MAKHVPKSRAAAIPSTLLGGECLVPSTAESLYSRKPLQRSPRIPPVAALAFGRTASCTADSVGREFEVDAREQGERVIDDVACAKPLW
jgi:hypothetical protein